MWAISVNVRTCCCRGFNRLVFVNGNVWSVSYLVIALFHQQKLNRIWKDGAYSPKLVIIMILLSPSQAAVWFFGHEV